MKKEIIEPFSGLPYSEEQLLNIEKVLKEIGINFRKNETEYRDIDLELLQEIADKWDELK